MEFSALIEYLAEVYPGLEFGRNVFVNSLPTDHNDEPFQILFRDTYAGIQIDPYIKDYRHGRITLAIRGYEYEKTRALIRKFSKILTITNREVGDVELKCVRPINEPVGFMLSEGGYWEFSVNFYVAYSLNINDEPEDD